MRTGGRRRAAAVLAVALGLAMLAGCEAILGTSGLTERAPGPDAAAGDGSHPPSEAGGSVDANASDAGSDVVPGDTGADATPIDAGDAGAAPADIVGTEVSYFITDTTTTHLNADFTGIPIVAHVLSPDGGVTDYPGTALGNGTFRIPGVPEGAEYFVQFAPYALGGPPVYAYSTSRTIDQSGYGYGRTDVAYTDGGAGVTTTSVQYDLTNVSPLVEAPDIVNGVQLGQDVLVGSLGIGNLWGIGWGTETTPITFSGSTITGTDTFASGTALIQSSRGDITYMLGYAPVLDGGIDPAVTPPYQLVQSFSPGHFEMATGGISYLTGAMQTLPIVTLPDGGPMTLAWDHGAFATVAGQISTTATPSTAMLMVTAVPLAHLGAAAAPFMNLFTYTLYGTDAENTTVEAIPLAYGDPFPATWERFVGASLYFSSQLAYPLPDGGTTPIKTGGFLICSYLLSDVLGQTIRPTVGPPLNIAINGRPATQDQSSVGLTPQISWDPPSFGMPTSYNVTLRDLSLAPDGTVVMSAVVAITTTGAIRSVAVPPGILQAGHTYVVSLSARLAASADQPGLIGAPSCYTNSTSGLVTP